MERPILKVQEIPYDDPASSRMFLPSAEKPFVATRPAIVMYQQDTIIACLRILRDLADRYNGLDYLQVFEDPDKEEALWFIEDDEGGAITALLPSDY